jgi:transcriptional regulator with XRE-family HTH domain
VKPDRHTGKRIGERREQLSLSQRDIGERTRYSYAYISRVGAGARTPSLSALIEFADVLDTTALYLATGRRTDCPFCGR